MRPLFSLIVPTRGRPAQLRRMLDSVARTASHPERIEVVLVVDDDDPASLATHPRLAVRHVVVAPGRTMGALNNAGFAASAGDYVMLLNDDVIVRTPGWDAIALRCFGRFPDPFALVHVNDTLMRDHLCTFPLTSRAFYELAGEVCSAEYERYRIDDHIEDVFNLLVVLGERRVVYLPDVVFEHDNATQHPEAGAVYLSDPVILAADAPRFDALLPRRKELAWRVCAAIGARPDPSRVAAFGAVTDSFAIRSPGRQIAIRSPWWRGPLDAVRRVLGTVNRARRKSAGELLRAIRKRLPVVRPLRDRSSEAGHGVAGPQPVLTPRERPG
ncbi:MAG: glycosyltransferase [Planctomycetes bacterium]|nr:glycosyltransferase [Planctomycetota bacterium]